MQVLQEIHELDEILQETDADFCRSLLAFRNELSLVNQPTPVYPLDFLRSIHAAAATYNRPIFQGWNQNDMPEFLLFLVDCLHKSLARPVTVDIDGYSEDATDELALLVFRRLQLLYAKEFSSLCPLFYGTCVSRVLLPNGTYTDAVADPHFILDLPIPSSSDGTLENCLHQYMQPEVLTDFKDETTGESIEGAKKEVRFFNFAPVVVIALKRFSNTQQKNCTPVSFPAFLDLSRYVVGYHPEKYRNYELFGVVNHMGGVHGGHYTAYVKTGDHRWMNCNDASVHEVTALSAEHAYCFFYRCRGTGGSPEGATPSATAEHR